MNQDFEPKILGFFCNWCSYAGADLAGVSRLKYPANLRIVRVMCSGRVEPTMVLKAFACGADGVLISGCHPGDCHYQQGNYKTLRRVPLLERTLAQFGIHPARFRLTWISANEGQKLVQVVTEMVEEIKKLGPFPGTRARFPELAPHLSGATVIPGGAIPAPGGATTTVGVPGATLVAGGETHD
ncbi:MAG: hydrogenase iron-sulfur subunit [Bacillota bacterium]|nr:hydrogenase iron-sulfur subunit [Bacillota bacterium]